MIRHFLTFGIVIGALSFLTAGSARACGDGCDFEYGYGWLYNSLRYEVPHFAAYPPVYYSYPVPRTYGYSPFAYPPNVMTPEIVGESEPVTIINPHVDTTKAKPTKAAKDRTAAIAPSTEPLIVINPFVAPNQAVAQTAR